MCQSPLCQTFLDVRYTALNKTGQAPRAFGSYMNKHLTEMDGTSHSNRWYEKAHIREGEEVVSGTDLQCWWPSRELFPEKGTRELPPGVLGGLTASKRLWVSLEHFTLEPIEFRDWMDLRVEKQGGMCPGCLAKRYQGKLQLNERGAGQEMFAGTFNVFNVNAY